ncbi:DsbA family protein [Consotaella salsifontis]|uniref:Protein-disulfide isomerase n=1 Tax=Consotaella salsifontis TaxID=1365950 RepID=A0A1T4S6N7_9HYPH|nr:DsbA family protein [Consotaella salsifontis]SKA23903.1 Protein-disulfide isomerase [Consotaella salsifontis]
MIHAPLTRRRLLLASAGLATAPLLARHADAAPGEADNPLSREAVLRDPRIPVLGNPKGDVTIVEFFDYQCPYCKKAHPDLEKVVEEDGNIRLVMKDWPIFGPPSIYASRLTLAAGRGYAKAQAALMATKGRLSPQEINAVLEKAGFDPDALNDAYVKDKERINAVLQRNSTQAEGFGLMGTPAYVIGTTLFPGVVDPAAMKQAVSQARKA